MPTRRDFLRTAGAVGLGTLAAGCAAPAALVPPVREAGFGPLVPTPNRPVHLPRGFSSRTVGLVGTHMSDALMVPMQASGVDVFDRGDGTLLVLVSHDIEPGTPSRSGPFGFHSHLMDQRWTPFVYDVGPEGDKPSYGCVTMGIYDPQTALFRQNGLLLSGIMRAARGAPTPRGTWLVGEAETRMPDDRYAQRHGYVFEVPVSDAPAPPRPLPALGRFAHAATVEDPRTGVVTMTEARPDGLLYRFVPAAPGDLTEGRLQAALLGGQLGGSATSIRWMDIDATDTGEDDLRARGAARGATPVGEAGLALDGEALLLSRAQDDGAVWRMSSEGEAESRLVPVLHGAGMPSRVTDAVRAPWGDLLVVCTGADGHALLAGLSAEREVYPILRSVRPDGLLGAPAFSPDGATMFINLARDGQTLAVRGPWPRTAGAA
jgi:hypothetical protein